MVTYDPSLMMPIRRNGKKCQVPFAEIAGGDLIDDTVRGYQFTVGVGAYEITTKDGHLDWTIVSDHGSHFFLSGFGADPVDVAKAANIGDVVKLGRLRNKGLFVDVTHDGAMTHIPKYTAGPITFEDDASDDYCVRWIKVSEDMLIADRNLLRNISWRDLDIYGYTRTNGVEMEINGCRYWVRVPTGGQGRGRAGKNEWDDFIINGPVPPTNDAWHWYEVHSICAETVLDATDLRVLRGGGAAEAWNCSAPTSFGENFGFRPVLIIPTAEN